MTAWKDLPEEERLEKQYRIMLHKRVRRARGKASAQQCVRCPAQGRDWAQVHTEDGTDIWADYVPMCRSCHIRYDYDARWNPESLGRWRASAAPAIAAAWTDDRRHQIAEVARQARLADPNPRDPVTGKFLKKRS